MLFLYVRRLISSRGDAEAGHSFEYDEMALERLRGLTRELRLGIKRKDESESEDEDENGRVGMKWNGKEVGEVDHEDEDDGEMGDEQEDGDRRVGVAWFEA